MHALLIPAGGEPEVLDREAWTAEAISAALDTLNFISAPLDWRPCPPRGLTLHGPDGQGSPNLAAITLADQDGWHFTTGPLLVTARTRIGRPTSLTPVELLLIVTRLMFGEINQRAIGS